MEYPTTRVMGADPRDRARDLTAAFADPTITAVLATVGGDDLITVTPHLDDAVLRANPKPYFGYSDNTNVLNHLYRLGHRRPTTAGRCWCTSAGRGSRTR